MAKVDSNGYIYILGRKKNVIISGGVNIYPEEIETVLERMPSVKHVFVEKTKNEVLGEVPVAKVVMNENFKFVESNLYEFARKNLDTLKIPRKIEQYTDKVSLLGLGKVGMEKHDY
ncbi:hypothetical protein HU830_01560 [Lactobacillus sp. DCY120]|uniref:AMP-binding enzyme C-terminal domain-containing protein n=1 Tax=Bombilactobacillus apium TaxID=2675299 RepID=A0A850RAP3_9LACO|nr:hypothetical protein [Bombilactobacillus apium]NVY95888.1 hypothetical protein [Bombilactobacillus apium]